MSERCMEHPWMTFFIVGAVINGVVNIALVLARGGRDDS